MSTISDIITSKNKKKSLMSHILLSLNYPACDDLSEFMHNPYITEISRHGAIVLSLTV